MRLLGRSGGNSRRRGTPSDLLVVGLGNPGEKYAGTRHNVGADVVDVLARRGGETLRDGREEALVAEVRIGEARVALAFPLTFMNESGRSVAKLLRRHGIEDPATLVVVHDELDLETGRLKLKFGGGLAGHNGLKSIKAHAHTADFARIRIGIDRPPGTQKVSDYVLRRPGKSERADLDIAVERAADAVEMIVSDGFDAAMNRFNQT